ncbi:MAG TPA: Clp protease N-terminal domain-containing protein [Candidatus Dormibacteraeota bacterium]|nr:Clp protease N-terminal domain-containing protein [Candidatus Dormibacteraeota bacterium]
MSRILAARRLAPVLVAWGIGPSVSHQFEIEAKRDGAKAIEAEHMLLALAAGPDGDVAKLLGEAGLDYHRLAAALRDERRRTLAFAGMKVPDTKLVATTELDGSLTFGTSAKAAIRRALVGARHERHRRHLRSTDLLAGILDAELGTVPRALAISGIDRAEMASRAWGFKG